MMRVAAFVSLSLSLLASGSHCISRDVPFIQELTVGGRPYIRYSTNNLILTKPETVTIGQKIEVTCEIDPNLYGSIRTCSLQNPNGDTLLVDSVTDQVLDLENGQPVQGLSPSNLGRPDSVCGVIIDAVSEADLGDWDCGMERTETDVPLFLRGAFNLRTGGDPTGLRLSRKAFATSYAVDVTPDFDAETIDGALAMEVTNTELNFGIKLHLHDMSIDERSLLVTDGNGYNAPVISLTFDYERDFVTIGHTPYTAAPESLSVSLKYTARLQTNGDGFYVDRYTTPSGEKKAVGATQFQPMGARLAFPCFDESGMKATFDIRIGTPAGMTSLSNMPVRRSGDAVDGRPGYTWYEFERTAVMSPYLIAFLVSDFASTGPDTSVTSYPVNIWARQESIDAGYGDYSARIAPPILECYAEYTGVAYPLPKMDFGAPPSKGGAMENWGLILHSETSLLIGETESGDRDKASLVSTVAHEVFHQWTGDIVTCDFWDELYLNEGYATLFSFYGTNCVEPQLKPFDRFYVDEMVSVLRSDAKVARHPTIQVGLENGYRTDFGDTTYNKGASVFRMVESFLTPATMRRGLGEYLAENSFKGVKSDQLWAAYDKVAVEDAVLRPDLTVKMIMDTWTLQKNYPLVTVTRDYQGGKASLSQERFLTEPDNSGDNREYAWWIPVTFAEEGSSVQFEEITNGDKWLAPGDDATEFDIGVEAGKAVIFNVQSFGFYRVNYDDTNWDLIATSLANNPDDINLINRAAIISDAITLAMTGTIPYEVPKKIVQYLRNERDYVPLYTAIKMFGYLANSGSTEGEELRQDMREILDGIFAETGIAENPDNTFLENMLQYYLSSSLCREGNTQCAAESAEVFGQWMQASNPDDPAQNPVNRNTRYPAYCTALRNGGLTEEVFLLERLARSVEPHETSALRSASFCAPNKVAAFDRLFGDRKAGEDTAEVLEKVLADADTRRAFGEWIEVNFDVEELGAAEIGEAVFKAFEEHSYSLEDVSIAHKYFTQFHKGSRAGENIQRSVDVRRK